MSESRVGTVLLGIGSASGALAMVLGGALSLATCFAGTGHSIPLSCTSGAHCTGSLVPTRLEAGSTIAVDVWLDHQGNGAVDVEVTLRSTKTAASHLLRTRLTEDEGGSTTGRYERIGSFPADDHGPWTAEVRTSGDLHLSRALIDVREGAVNGFEVGLALLTLGFVISLSCNIGLMGRAARKHADGSAPGGPHVAPRL